VKVRALRPETSVLQRGLMFEIAQSRLLSNFSSVYYYNIWLLYCAHACATMRVTRLTRTYRRSGVQVQMLMLTHDRLMSQSLCDYVFRSSQAVQLTAFPPFVSNRRHQAKMEVSVGFTAAQPCSA
jgi:hypothetical protein